MIHRYEGTFWFSRLSEADLLLEKIVNFYMPGMISVQDAGMIG
jgi:hypothetical protein